MELIGLTTFGLLGYWFSEIFWRLLIAVFVVLFAYKKFGTNIFLRNVLIVIICALGCGIIFTSIYYIMIIPRFISQLFGLFSGIFY